MIDLFRFIYKQMGVKLFFCFADDEEGSVTPVEDNDSADDGTEEQDEQTDETSTETEAGDTESDVDYRQMYTELKDEVKNLKSYIASRAEEEEESGDNYDVPKDVKEFLQQFAENPQDVLEKFVSHKLGSVDKTLREIEQQTAIDYIQTQKDFTDGMIDELTYIIEGPDRNRWFNFGNQQVQLKNLRPRQKAEAALQIFRAKKKGKTISDKSAPKPPTTSKTKPSGKKNDKADDVLTAEEFAKKHGLKKGAL